MIKYLLIFTLFLSLLPFFKTYADESSKLNNEDIPAIFQPEHRKKRPPQVELSPYGGSYLGSSIGQTWTAGGKAYFHADSTWSFGINYAYSKLMTDRSSTFGQSLKNTNMHLADVEFAISNDVAMRAGRTLIEIDFYLTLGAGAITINEDWEPMGVIGGGAKFYMPVPWLAFRIDVNNYAHYTNKPGNDNFDFDITFVGGVSFMFPFQKNKYKAKLAL